MRNSKPLAYQHDVPKNNVMKSSSFIEHTSPGVLPEKQQFNNK